MKRSTYPIYFMSFILLVLVTSTSGCSRPVEHAAVSDEAGEASQRSAGDSLIIMLPGEVPLELVWIPPGTFMMDSPEDEQDRSSVESPQHEVTIAKGFWMGKYPITQAQWKTLKIDYSTLFPGDDRPLESVYLGDIQATFGFLHELNTLNPDYNFRLPSEAEWEYAVRAGTTTRFYWGDDPDYTEIDAYAWYGENSGGETHNVGLKLPNAWGLYDMSGSVEEWCDDSSHEHYIGAPNDGSAWREYPRDATRVMRGGSYQDLAKSCRSASRSSGSIYPGDWCSNGGFRVVWMP